MQTIYLHQQFFKKFLFLQKFVKKKISISKVIFTKDHFHDFREIDFTTEIYKIIFTEKSSSSTVLTLKASCLQRRSHSCGIKGRVWLSKKTQNDLLPTSETSTPLAKIRGLPATAQMIQVAEMAILQFASVLNVMDSMGYTTAKYRSRLIKTRV